MQKRKEIYREVVNAFERKYSWLGAQAAQELLLSAATWNIEKNNEVPMRYRTHCVLAWERGWLKSSILTKMASVLGEDLCTTMGKVTDAGMRGSLSGGSFTPPKPLKAPFVISTEFGQTTFEDELLNVFLSLLEEGYTNVSMNKVGQMSESQKRDIEQQYDGAINFGGENEFDLKTNFVFWGATYDPAKLDDDALRSRFNVVTPKNPLTGAVTETIDKGYFNLNQDTVRALRRELKSDEESEVDFKPPTHLYEKYSLIPRESRDLQAYMAARNWWGLEVNPSIMENYVEHMKDSRKRSNMSPEDLIFHLIFNNPMSLDELDDETRYNEEEIYKMLTDLKKHRGAQMTPFKGGRKWVIWSGNKGEEEEDEEETGFLDGV